MMGFYSLCPKFDKIGHLEKHIEDAEDIAHYQWT